YLSMRRALIIAFIVALPLAVSPFARSEDPKKPDPETLGARIRAATTRAAKALAAQEQKAKPEYPVLSQEPIEPGYKMLVALALATRALCEGRGLTDDGKGCAWCYDVAPFSSDTPTGDGTGPGETPANLAKPGKTGPDDTGLPPPGKGGVPMPPAHKGPVIPA